MKLILNYEDLLIAQASLFHENFYSTFQNAKRNPKPHRILEINPILERWHYELFWVEDLYAIGKFFDLNRRECKVIRNSYYTITPELVTIRKKVINSALKKGYDRKDDEELLTFLGDRAHNTLLISHIMKQVNEMITYEARRLNSTR